MNLVTFFGPLKIFFGLEFGPPKRDWRRQFWAIQVRRRQEAPKMIGARWACAVLFFPALPERTRWLHGLDCHTISFTTTCRLSTQARHLTGENRWTCRDWATNFPPPKGPIPALRILHPRNFLLKGNRASWELQDRDVAGSAKATAMGNRRCFPNGVFQSGKLGGWSGSTTAEGADKWLANENQAKVFLHKVFPNAPGEHPKSQDVPAQIPGIPSLSLSKTTGKGALHRLFVRDIPGPAWPGSGIS